MSLKPCPLMDIIDCFDINDVYCTLSGQEWQVRLDNTHNKKWYTFKSSHLDPSSVDLYVTTIVIDEQSTCAKTRKLRNRTLKQS